MEEAKKNWTAASHELIFTAVFPDSSSRDGLCTSRSPKELGLKQTRHAPTEKAVV
jgi:hypothetical protein